MNMDGTGAPAWDPPDPPWGANEDATGSPPSGVHEPEADGRPFADFPAANSGTGSSVASKSVVPRGNCLQRTKNRGTFERNPGKSATRLGHFNRVPHRTIFQASLLGTLALSVWVLSGCGTVTLPGRGYQLPAAYFLPNHISAPSGFGPGQGILSYLTTKLGWDLVPMGAAAGSEGARLERTANGGRTWTSIASTNPRAGEGQLPTTGYKTGVSFVNPMKGWLTGSQWATSQPARPELYTTSDGGRHWSAVSLSMTSARSHQSFVLDPPGFVSPDDGLLIGYYGQVGAPGTIAMLWVTTNGGLTWHSEPPRRSGSAAGLSWTTSGATTIVMAYHGYRWKTTNDGLTWTPVHS